MKKKLFIPLILLLIVACFAACSREAKPLVNPAIVLSDKTVSWNAIENADGYVLEAKGDNGEAYSVPTTATSYSLDFLDIDGNYTLRVKATSNTKKYSDSEYSNSIIYSLFGVSQPRQKLNTPTGVYIASGALKFTAVSGAERYRIYLDGTFVAVVTATSYTIPTLDDGSHYVEIEAIAGTNSIYSDSSKTVPHYFTVLGGVVQLEVLSAPENLSLRGHRVHWTGVYHSSGYRVSIDGAEGILSVDSFLEISLSGTTTHTITVKCVGDGSTYADSPWSKPLVTPVVLQATQSAMLGGLLSWTAVDNAEEYEVLIDATTYTITETHYAVDVTVLADGTHSARVRATANVEYYAAAPYSQEILFEVSNGAISPATLDTPSTPIMANGVISWSAVDYATGYEVRINGESHLTPSTSYAHSVNVGSFVVDVRAKGDGTNTLDSLWSAEMEFGSTARGALANSVFTSFNSNILRWSIPSGAASNFSFTVLVNESKYEGQDSFFDFSMMDNGTYLVRVKGSGTGTYNNYSAEYAVVLPYVQQDTLQAPEGLSITGGELRWNAASGATGYEIYLDGQLIGYPTNRAALTISDYEEVLSNGLHYFTVRSYRAASATATEQYSVHSVGIAYRVELPPEEPIVEYFISTAEQLAAMSQDLQGKYTLTADIDLVGIEWTAIGTTEAPFVGELDGAGHTISHLTMPYGSALYGLFGVNNGYIHDLSLTDIALSVGSDEVYATYACGSISAVNHGLVQIVSVTGSIVTERRLPVIGGLVGQNTGIVIGATVDMDITIDNGQNVQQVFAGLAVGENRGWLSANIHGLLKVVSDNTSEYSIGGAIAVNRGCADLNLIGDDGIQLQLGISKGTAAFGGVICMQYPIISVISDTTAEVYSGISYGSLDLPNGITIRGTKMHISGDIDTLNVTVAGLINTNVIDIDFTGITLPTPDVDLCLSAGATIGAVFVENEGMVSGLELANATLIVRETAEQKSAFFVKASGFADINKGIAQNIELSANVTYALTFGSLVYNGFAYMNKGVLRDSSIDVVFSVTDDGAVEYNGIVHTNDTDAECDNVEVQTTFSSSLAMSSMYYCGAIRQNSGDGSEVSVINTIDIPFAVRELTKVAGVCGTNSGDLVNADVSSDITIGDSNVLGTDSAYLRSICGAVDTNNGSIVDLDVTEFSLQYTISFGYVSSPFGRLTVSGGVTSNVGNASISGLQVATVNVDLSVIGSDVQYAGLVDNSYGSVSDSSVASVLSGSVTRGSVIASGMINTIGAGVTQCAAQTDIQLNAESGNLSVNGIAQRVAAGRQEKLQCFTRLAPTVANFSGVANEVASVATFDSVYSVFDVSRTTGTSGNYCGAFTSCEGTAQDVVVTGSFRLTDETSQVYAACPTAVVGVYASAVYSDIAFVEQYQTAQDSITAANAIGDYFVHSEGIVRPTSMVLSDCFGEAFTAPSVLSLNVSNGTVYDMAKLLGITPTCGSVPVWTVSATTAATITPSGVLTIKRNGAVQLSAKYPALNADGVIVLNIAVTCNITGFTDMGGDGSSDYPYIVDNAEKLLAIYEHPDKAYRMTADIVLPDIQGALYTSEIPFSGILDGNGHCITINTATATAEGGLSLLSATEGATIQKLDLIYANIVTPIDSVLSFGGITLSAVDTDISDCTVTYVTGVTVTNVSTDFGGIALSLDADSTIKRCAVDMSSLSFSATSSVRFGAVAVTSAAFITDTYAKQNIQVVSNGLNYGGFVAENKGNIVKCYSAGILDIAASTAYIGGFTAMNRGTISNCYAAMRMTANVTAGHIAGFAATTYTDITSSYVTGSLRKTGGAYTGAFITQFDAGNLSESYSGITYCAVDNLCFGYGGTVVDALGTEIDSLSVDVSVIDMSTVTPQQFLNVYWAAPTTELPYPTILALPGQNMSDILPTGSVTDIAYSSLGSVIAEQLSDTNSYDAVFTLSSYEIISGGTCASITSNSTLHVLKNGSVTITVSNGENSRDITFAVTIFDNGDGTSANPFLIRSYDDFARIPMSLSSSYRIDSTLSGFDFEGHTPAIGTADAPFTGSFDGSNVPMYGIKLYATNSFGLFNYAEGAVLSNIVIKDKEGGYGATLTMGNSTGTLSGGAIVGTARDCTITAVDVVLQYAMTYAFYAYNTEVVSLSVGGIAGNTENTTITDSDVKVVSGNVFDNVSYSDKLHIAAYAFGDVAVSGCTADMQLAFLVFYKYTTEGQSFAIADLFDSSAVTIYDYSVLTLPEDYEGTVLTYDDIVAGNHITITSNVISIAASGNGYDIIKVHATDTAGNTLVAEYRLTAVDLR